MRTIDLYLVSKIPNIKPDEQVDFVTFNTHLCTIVNSMKEVKEYIIQRGICEHYEHYISWCELHKLDPAEQSSKDKYTEDFLTELNYGKDFRIKKFKYTKEGIASILRMFNGCLPVGASYELDSENIYFTQLLKNFTSDEEKEGEK